VLRNGCAPGVWFAVLPQLGLMPGMMPGLPQPGLMPGLAGMMPGLPQPPVAPPPAFAAPPMMAAPPPMAVGVAGSIGAAGVTSNEGWIKLRGIPFTVSKPDIVAFFAVRRGRVRSGDA
jgi:hypothetical protein